MNRLVKALLIVLLLISNAPSWAAGQPSMEETMFQSGKIYVFFAVSTVIVLGMIIYLITLDRKIGRIERELKEESK